MSITGLLDSALTETQGRALVYAQVLEFALTEFRYIEAFSSEAETKARAAAAALYIQTRIDGLRL